jgi:3-oxoacyl-[acyl-carrier protein] reductase
MKSFTGKVVVVTGASKGIGAGIARVFGERGASVVVNYKRDESAAKKVVEDIQAAGGKALAVQGDVADAKSAKALIEAAAKKMGPIDVLVNNAGVYEFAPVENFSKEHLYRIFDVNVAGLLQTIQAALERFNSEGGSIINISSNIWKTVPPHALAYAASKSSVDVITRALAKGLAPKKIRVNAIASGMTETDGAHAVGAIGSEWHKTVEKATPLGRIAQPVDMGRVAAFLASEDAGWVTGQILNVDGGFAN